MLDLGIVYLRFYQVFGRFPSDETGNRLLVALKNGVYPSEIANVITAMGQEDVARADEKLLQEVRRIYLVKQEKRQGAPSALP